jgi:hypothetical protein
MTQKMRIAIFLLLLVVMTACSSGEPSHRGSADARAAGAQADPSAMLAYEHALRIELPNGQLEARVAETQAACATARFGSCHLLNFWRGEENVAELRVRVSPAGVDPLIALASGEDGKVLRRETKAEDLAQAVQDNQRQEALLASYAENMKALSKRPGITVADLIALAREQADVEQKREALAQEAAQQTRRIETHLLTLYLAEKGASEDSFTHRFAEMWNLRFSRGVVVVIELVLYAFILLPLFFAACALWRWAWVRLFRRKATNVQSS